MRIRRDIMLKGRLGRMALLVACGNLKSRSGVLRASQLFGKKQCQKPNETPIPAEFAIMEHRAFSAPAPCQESIRNLKADLFRTIATFIVIMRCALPRGRLFLSKTKAAP